MPSKFLISIVREDGQKTFLRPGSYGELDLIQAIIDTTIRKGVGLFRTESHVKQDLTDALNEVLFSLKAEVLAD
jgi:hypothetical protein